MSIIEVKPTKFFNTDCENAVISREDRKKIIQKASEKNTGNNKYVIRDDKYADFSIKRFVIKLSDKRSAVIEFAEDEAYCCRALMRLCVHEKNSIHNDCKCLKEKFNLINLAVIALADDNCSGNKNQFININTSKGYTTFRDINTVLIE
jgi:hypothetical protein